MTPSRKSLRQQPLLTTKRVCSIQLQDVQAQNDNAHFACSPATAHQSFSKSRRAKRSFLLLHVPSESLEEQKIFARSKYKRTLSITPYTFLYTAQQHAHAARLQGGQSFPTALHGLAKYLVRSSTATCFSFPIFNSFVQKQTPVSPKHRTRLFTRGCLYARRLKCSPTSHSTPRMHQNHVSPRHAPFIPAAHKFAYCVRIHTLTRSPATDTKIRKQPSRRSRVNTANLPKRFNSH